MAASYKRNPISFPARVSDAHGPGANAFSFGSKDSHVDRFSAIMFDGVVNPLSFFAKAIELTKENLKAVDTILGSVQSGSATFREKLISNSIANLDTALHTATSIEFPHHAADIASLQSAFIQKQLQNYAEQSKELVALSNEIIQQTLSTFQAATLRTLEVSFKFK